MCDIDDSDCEDEDEDQNKRKRKNDKKRKKILNQDKIEPVIDNMKKLSLEQNIELDDDTYLINYDLTTWCDNIENHLDRDNAHYL